MSLMVVAALAVSLQIHVDDIPASELSGRLGYDLGHGRYDVAEAIYKKYGRLDYPIAPGDRPPGAMSYIVAIARYPGNVSFVKEACTWMLDRGASANGYKGGPIANAVFDKTGEMLRFLLKKGASPHLFDPEKDAPLYSAIYHKIPTITDILLREGVNVNRQVSKEGQTPLMWAAQHGDDRLSIRLIQAGAKLNLQQRATRRTALHWAVTNDQASVVDLLLRRGANRNLRDGNRRTPLELARKLGAKRSIAKLQAK
jgi:uncharacterized protein